ncbi:DUF1642 domain-containing protein [Lacticaseibacillus hegangensis]|uniref:DUF1642 domain-containing protein n=1 Tax=Lacticaseibacillus hegangensis TaxID=2486010 RepID=A0ABW4CXE0_9LACO|nr:DUF1642 domain-containing protein [Lacticaseibacillus hegangensis]
MSNETKRDVFEDLLDAYGDAISGGGQGDNGHPAEYRLRYSSALPDDLPVIPKSVGEYLKRYKLMFTLFGFLRDAVSHIDTPLDALNQTKYHWIANNQNTFARAWLLGIWRVEETGEIVKLEEEVRDE